MHKTRIEKTPVHIHSKIRIPTRETRKNLLQDKRNFKTATALKSFIPRTIKDWNALPADLTQTTDFKMFKTKLRKYIMENTSVK